MTTPARSSRWQHCTPAPSRPRSRRRSRQADHQAGAPPLPADL